MAQNARDHGAGRLLLHWNGRQLIITDNGRGFVDVDLTRLGQPFFTTRREEGGTGLGLAIVIAILDLYGATLRPVRQEEGARFEIDFPGD
jgi:signal transduction histidine kinase